VCVCVHPFSKSMDLVLIVQQSLDIQGHGTMAMFLSVAAY
jgi:hypothetical protein